MPLTPEEKRAEKAKEDAAIQERRKYMAHQVNSVLSTEAGKAVFKYLHDICGFAKACRVTTSTGAVDPIGTTCNDERRSIYLQLRAHADPRLLMSVEYADHSEVKKEEKL